MAALFATGGFCSPDEAGFVSENERVAAYFVATADETFGVRMELVEAVRDPKRKRDKFTFSCRGADAARIYVKTVRCNPALLEEDAALAYLRAAFLSGGSCTIPKAGAKTGYHIQFDFGDRTAAEGFLELLSSFMLLAKEMERAGKYVVYAKSIDVLSDFCSVSGARGALRTLESLAADRELNNNENRVSNCIQGNADKAAIASAGQAVAIRALQERGVLAQLPAALKEAAEARLKEPALSLSELAGKLGVSKSCLNHRMRKLMELYEKEKQ